MLGKQYNNCSGLLGKERLADADAGGINVCTWATFTLARLGIARLITLGYHETMGGVNAVKYCYFFNIF